MHKNFLLQRPNFLFPTILFSLLFTFSNSIAEVEQLKDTSYGENEDKYSGRTVTAISIKGNSRIDQESILSVISTKVGSSLDTKVAEQDIKAIYRLGFFDFAEVDIVNDSQGVILVFILKERPAIKEIRFSGNDEFSSDTLKEKLNLEARKFLDKRKINASIKELQKYYQQEGYYGTEVNYKTEEIKSGEVSLTFNIKEGKRKLIRKVTFDGNSNIDSSKLSSAVSTSKYSWLWSWATGSGVVKKEQLENDTRIVQHEYLTRGFADVKIANPEIKELDNGLEVVFGIEEGEKYRFGKISTSGSTLPGGNKENLRDIKSITGDDFNVDLLREDVFLITDKFTDIGYAFTNVDPISKINRENKTVDLEFNVDQGNKIKVNRINIIGNDKTKDNVVRRNLRISEQETYSSSKIKRSQELIKRLGFFDEVSISPEKTEKPGEVDLAVSVKEAMTGQFSAGAGLSSGDGFLVTSRISENNLMGSGNALSLDINSGQLRQNYVLSFNNPRVNDSFFSFGVEGAVMQRDFQDFVRNQNGGSVTTGYPLTFLGEESVDDIRATLGYELMQNEITDIGEDVAPLVREQEGRSVTSAIIPGLTRSTIDNPLDPSSGSRQVSRFEYAALGGSQQYWLGTVNNYWYYPVVKTSYGNFVFSQRTKFGYGEPIGGENFPLFQRFFPGGINSLRGFDARRVGPRDDRGNYFGGNKQLIMNFEMIFPLAPSIGLNGVAFYDAGNAYDDTESIDVANLRQAVGWGFRWRSPLAPIRFEIGYPLDRKPGENAVVTNFSFGAPL